MPMPPLFPDSAVQTMRAVHEANLPHTCQIKAAALGGRVGGVASETWADVGAPISCRVSIAGGAGEQLTRDQLSNVSRYEVVLPVTVTTITRKNRLQVSGDFNGIAWSMLLKIDGPVGPKLAQVMRRYLCSVVSGEGA